MATSTQTIVNVPDWARSSVQGYAQAAWNLSQQLAPAPAVFISSGLGAKAAAVLDTSTNTGAVQQIVLTSGGSGFTSMPNLSIVSADGNGQGASAYVNVDYDLGVVTSVVVASGGIGYTAPPIISITGGGGVGATAYSITGYYKLSSINVLTSGDFYVIAPAVSILPADGRGAGAAATANISNNKVTSITLTEPGNGYTAVPFVILQSVGQGASAEAFVAGGVVSGISLISGGNNYQNAPLVILLGGTGIGATASCTIDLTGAVDTISIISSGSGYSDTISTITPYAGTIIATQNSNETTGIAALATRARNSDATIADAIAFVENIIQGGNLAGLSTTLLAKISSELSGGFNQVQALIGKKSMYVGDPDTTLLAQTLTSGTAATYYARLAAELENDNYQKERASMDNAMGYGVELAKQSAIDAELLRKAGLYMREYTQGTYEITHKLFIETQEDPIVRLEIFGNMLRALTNSMQTTTQNYNDPSSMMQVVGIMSAAAGTYQALNTAGVFSSSAAAYTGATSMGVEAGILDLEDVAAMAAIA